MTKSHEEKKAEAKQEAEKAALENKRKDDEMEELLNGTPPARLSIGMGLHNEVFYYGSKIWHTRLHRFVDAIITSERKLYLDERKKVRRDGDTEFEGVNQIRDEFGIEYKHGFLVDAISHHWSLNDSKFSIKTYLNCDAEIVDGRKLFDAIVKENKRFIYHTDNQIHELTALYIITTYFLQLFSDMGRMHFIGAGESGKTSQCRLISFYCFNPLSLASMTESYLYNTVESTSGTIILDDLDDLAEETKRALKHVDKVGYKKEFAKRGTMAQDRSGRANTDRYFCAFIKNSIDDLESVSASRNFVVDMTKVPKGIRLEKIRRNAKPDQELRDMLHVWAMQNYQTVIANYRDLPDISGLNSRQEEIAAPLLAVAKTIDDSLYQNMINYLPKRADKQKAQTEQNSIFVVALSELLKNIIPTIDKPSERIVFDFSTLVGWTNTALEQSPEEKQSLAIRLGREFKQHRAIFDLTRSRNKARYSTDKRGFLSFLETRGYLKLMGDEVPEKWQEEINLWKKQVLTTE